MIYVVKVGGNALDNADLAHNAWQEFVRDVASILNDGDQVVIVHGAGPRINHVAAAFDVTGTFIDGLRVTTPDMMAVVARAVGHVTADVTSALNADKSISALGLTGASVISGHSVGEQWGQVAGDLTVDGSALRSLLESGFTPVVSCVVGDGTGGLLNANADHVAGAIAATLRADVLIQMTDVAQLRTNPDDPQTAISHVSVSDVDEMIGRGDIREGMIPKMQAAAVAVRHGAQCVVMASGLEAGALGRARRREGLYTEVMA